MAFQPGTIQNVLATRAYPDFSGNLGAEGIDALMRAGLRVKNSGAGNPPDIKRKNFPSQDETPLTVYLGAGRVYSVFAKSPAAATGGVIVQLTDNDIVIACFKLAATKSAEIFLYAGIDGIGVPTVTDLEVLVLDDDGSSNPAAGDQPDVVVLYGQD